MTKDTTLKQRIYHEILDGILSGRFPLDSFLKEGELATLFGVSKAPVREALVQLRTENVVQSIPRAGYQIVRLSPREIKDATGLRLIIETQALRLAFPFLVQHGRKELHDLNEEICEQAFSRNVTLSEWWQGNKRFHLYLASYADNALLSETLEGIFAILWRAIRQIFSGHDRSMFQRHEPSSHREIEKAIHDGNLDEATKMLSRDITSINTRFMY